MATTETAERRVGLAGRLRSDRAAPAGRPMGVSPARRASECIGLPPADGVASGQRRASECAGRPVDGQTASAGSGTSGFGGHSAKGRVRLTRRGRVVVLVALLILAALAAVFVASASRAADPAGPAPTTVVQPGDTLWSVAERHVPSADPFTAIEEIRRLNGLTDYTIHPGQTIILPDRR